MNDRKIVGGCYCGFCATLHGVATVPAPEDLDPMPANARRVSRETYRDWLSAASRVHRAYLSRRFGESFA